MNDDTAMESSGMYKDPTT